MGKYKDKVVWITGASSGIGEACTYAFDKAGAKLVLSSRRQAELERVKANCSQSADRILVLPLDLANHEEMDDKAKKVHQHFGRIDVLLNNGGISQRSLIKDTEFNVFKRLMDIDYLGTVAISKAVLPYYLQQKSGQYGVVTSLMGKFSSPLRGGYCGAKHALHGFFDAMRLEHEDDGVEVTLICPGFIKTEISKNALVADGSKQNKMDNATGKGLSAEDCAKQIVSAMTKNKFEVLIGGKETAAVYIKRFFPNMLHRIVKKASVT